METFEQKSYYVCRYNKLEQIIQNHFTNTEWSFLRGIGIQGNDSYKIIDVSFDLDPETLLEIKKEISEGIGEDHDSVYPEDIMLLLVAEGIIPKGKYLIDCSW